MNILYIIFNKMSIPFGQLFQLKINMVIPLTHHKKNSDLAELKVVGGYLLFTAFSAGVLKG